MKIVEIIPSLGSGGAERFVVDLCNELSKFNDVTLISLYSLDIPIKSFYKTDVSNKVRLLSLNKKTGIDVRMFFMVSKILRELKPDIVHTHTGGFIYIQPSIILYRKPKYFHTIHNDAEKEAGDKLTTLFKRFVFRRRIVTPITISKESLNSFVKFYHISAPMIYNGRVVDLESKISDSLLIEFQKYRLTEKTRVIVNIARMFPQKRQELLARVAKRLENEGFDFSLLIIGKKDKKIQAKIEEAGCSRLYILGEKCNPLHYMRMADAFTLSSGYEGMPISFIEALGVGCIPLCTPVGGIKDVINNGINGFISEDISEGSYYEMLRSYLEYEHDKLDMIKENAKKSYKPFTAETCAIGHMRLYNEIITKS